MLIALLLGALGLALLFPKTPIGKALSRLLVDLPARTLNTMTFGRIVVGLCVLAMIYGLIALIRHGGAIMGAPDMEALALMGTIDLGALIDAGALTLMIAATIRLRSAWRAIRQTVKPWARALKGAALRLAKGRARRSRPPARRPPGEDDDRPAPGLAWA